MGIISSKLGDLGVVTTTLDTAVNWARTGAMWPLLFGLACCAIEMMSTQASDYDLSRFGMELNRASPRQADLIIVAGRVTRKMAPVIRTLYDQMAAPRYVLAMGDCASCGGVYNNYAVVQGVDEIVPVDVYVAGCPPRPEQLIHGIMTLHEKVRGERLKTWVSAEGVR
jgi:NADH-quinone oxidoreductase subunit B